MLLLAVLQIRAPLLFVTSQLTKVVCVLLSVRRICALRHSTALHDREGDIRLSIRAM
jgi:hypothetical protein